MFSGNTDCYQPLEGKYQLTQALPRGLPRVPQPGPRHHEGRAHPRATSTLLGKLAREARCSVTISIPFADDEMARAIEPYAASATARFETLRALVDAGIETGGQHRAGHPRPQRHADPGDPRAREGGRRDERRAHAVLRLAAEVMPVFMERMEPRSRAGSPR